MTAAPTAAGEQEETDRPRAELGIVLAPGLVHQVTAGIAEELLADLRRRYDFVAWRGVLEVDRLVAPPASLTEIFEAARRRLLEADWDLAVVVTDLPLKLGGKPVTRHLSPTHRVAVLSLPALGAIHLRARLRRALVALIDELVRAEAGSGWEDAVLRELAADTDATQSHRVLFVLKVVVGHVRLLLGMVRANRPWRLAARLWGALVAGVGVAAFGLLTLDIWRIALAMGWWRLAATCLVSLLATAAAVIAAHGLWERAPDARVRDQVVLFNLTTAVTVLIGIATLYAALFALVLGGAVLTVTRVALEPAVGHTVTFADYVALAWFVASLGTVAGGLGAGLESREAMREAAYASTAADEIAVRQEVVS